jgi:hypothetical protein
LDPLLRPSATEFLRMLKALGRKNESWTPVGVADLTGKVKQVDSIDDQIRYSKEYTIWKWVDLKTPYEWLTRFI